MSIAWLGCGHWSARWSILMNAGRKISSDLSVAILINHEVALCPSPICSFLPNMSLPPQCVPSSQMCPLQCVSVSQTICADRTCRALSCIVACRAKGKCHWVFNETKRFRFLKSLVSKLLLCLGLRIRVRLRVKFLTI